MDKRVSDKIKEVEELLLELDDIRVNTLEQYLGDLKTRAACERYFEKIIEAIFDLVFLIIKQKKFKVPKEDEGALKVLVDEGVIDDGLYSRLSNAKGMRNFIIHQYEKIDDELVFEAVNGEIQKDVNGFLDVVREMR